MRSVLIKQEPQVSNFLFYLYIYFVFDFFLHLSARIPAYGVLRPTMLLAILISILLLAQKDRFPAIGSDPVFKAVKILILYIIITLPLVTWPGSVIVNNMPVFVKAVVFFFFTALIIDTDKRLKIFILVFMACQTFRVLEPLYLNITSGYWGSATHLGFDQFALRLSGAPADVINPNGLGFVIVTIIPYWYYLGWHGKSTLVKVLFLITVPLLIYALVLTMSRGAFLALLVVFGMLFKDSTHKAFFIAIAIVAVVFIWANLSDVHKDRYLSLVDPSSSQSSSAQGRIDGMKSEFGVALKRPIVGHGLGTSKEAKVHAGVGWLISHNLYIEIFIELGFIGFIIFMRFLKSIYAKFKSNLDSLQQHQNLAADVFVKNLNMTMKTVFWMYVIYSINYFGLSVYYWYMFGGLAIAYSRIYFDKARVVNHEVVKA